ncbi:hypothetical protein Hanom_Chr03g00251241 [Helianthus anomalus]
MRMVSRLKRSRVNQRRQTREQASLVDLESRLRKISRISSSGSVELMRSWPFMVEVGT